jgi:hypothetical protein
LEKIPQPAEVELGMPLLQDPTVAGIGEAALIGVYPEKIKGRLTGRWHEQHTIDLDGHRHAVLVTNPQAQYSQTDAYFFGGFSQKQPALAVLVIEYTTTLVN